MSHTSERRAPEETIKEQLVLRLGGSLCGFPVSFIKEIRDVEQIAPVPHSSCHMRGLVDVRGASLALIDIAPLLNLPASQEVDESRVIVLEFEQSDKIFEIAVLAEAVTAVAALTEDSADEGSNLGASSGPFVHGISRFEDQQVVEVDLPSLLSSLASDIAAAAA